MSISIIFSEFDGLFFVKYIKNSFTINFLQYVTYQKENFKNVLKQRKKIKKKNYLILH
jgi:hypothetical protein